MKTKVRIDYDGTSVDDVAIRANKSVFRLEQMDDDWYWIAFYPPKGERYTFEIYIKNGKLRCRNPEPEIADIK